MTTHVICNRCGKPMRPVVSYGTDEPTQGFCFCPPPVGWGHYTLAPVDWRDAELARLRADLAEARAALEQAKSDVERWSGSSGFYSDSLAMANESAKVLQAERDKYAAALVEIRGICTAMMDGWGQTATVLDSIRKITLAAIKRQPTEPAHRPETFA